MFARLLLLIYPVVVTSFHCPYEGGEPQLNGIYLEGYWYEFLRTNDYLNDNPCSHFEIECTNKTSCIISHVVWESYILRTIYEATITQEENEVKLENNSTITSVNLKYGNNEVLVWNCSGNNLEFASLFLRMETNLEMPAVWESAKNNKDFPEILNEFPPGIWEKLNTKFASLFLEMETNLETSDV
ncbi:hypothetical protein GWI33_003497 [Rhynchophorus ferrugineus]|uniref:Uncharacterized protein n=1 Tax=Rhynchophorus ferrugineus TaxID=354439 RepID=A0A834ILK6_RHYFE|nr:hypothetical protein GWI33_003497 [Rhynchophorus ferrugineus]